MRGLVITPKTILSSAARTSSSNSNAFKVQATNSIRVYVDVTARSGASPTLDITIQTSPDNTNWYDATDLTQITTTGQYTGTATIIGPYMRVKYTIGGTNTPSFTFSVKMTKYNWAR